MNSDTERLAWLNAHGHSIGREEHNGIVYRFVSWFDNQNCWQHTYGKDLSDCIDQAVAGFARAGTKLTVKLPPGRAYKI